MTTTKEEKISWQERADPLMKRFRELDAVCTWEGSASLNTDKPRQKDVIIQHWYTRPCEGGQARYYLVQIWADGSGWNVFGELDNTNSTEATIAKIV